VHAKRFSASQAHRLDDPARRQWLPPDEVLAALAVRPGETVADVGVGTGYFALPLAHAVGPLGKIYAVDGQQEMLDRLRAKLDIPVPAPIEIVHAEADQTGLPPSSCDLWLLANLWHELDDCNAALRDAHRALKPGGRIAILDWRPDVEPAAGPPLEHRLTPAHAVEHLRAAGFEAMAPSNVGRYSWLVQGMAKK
jgi:ubiquinone/menaquinone biosynthesis C-methylase UbiE